MDVTARCRGAAHRVSMQGRKDGTNERGCKMAKHGNAHFLEPSRKEVKIKKKRLLLVYMSPSKRHLGASPMGQRKHLVRVPPTGPQSPASPVP